MRCDIPECRRCLFCIPLRYGILTFGYLNLLFTLFIISLEVCIAYRHPTAPKSMAMYRGVLIKTQLWFTFLLYILEAVFNVILLVGAHTKRPVLIKIYYFYGILTIVATCLMFFVSRYTDRYGEIDLNLDYFEMCLAFCGFVLNLYLLLLIRTELQKLDYNQGQFSYVNHTSEAVLEPPFFGDRTNPL